MDYSKLRGRIIEVYGSNSAFAAHIGKTPQTIQNKLECRSELRTPEILEWAAELGIKAKDIPSYFFTQKVLKTELKE